MVEQTPKSTGRTGKGRSNQIETLREQVTQLAALVEQQQAEIDELREQRAVEQTPHEPNGTATGGMQSRRTLLKWGGAAAAAATVAVVASQGQSVRAAGATDGSALVVGQGNSGTAETSLTGTSGNVASVLFAVDNSAGASFAIEGIAGPGLPAIHGDGSTPTGAGIWGTTDAGYGVACDSGTGIDIIVGGHGGQGRIQQILQVAAGAPISGAYNAGEQIRDANGDLWLCVADGSPGTWVRAAHMPNGYAGGGVAYLSKPIRLLDTRGSDTNALHDGGGPYTVPGGPYSLVIAGVLWQSVQVPSTAVGAIGKVTVISQPSGSGFVALVPSGSGSPTTGTLPYGASQIVATSFNVGLGGSPGAIDIFIGGTPVDVVIDLFGVVA